MEFSNEMELVYHVISQETELGYRCIYCDFKTGNEKLFNRHVIDGNCGDTSPIYFGEEAIDRAWESNWARDFHLCAQSPRERSK